MAGNLNFSEYHAFASFTFSATTYYVGTQAEVRASNTYDGVIATAPELGMAFGDTLSLTQATNVDLVLGDGAAGQYRALVAGNILDGTQVTVTLVMRQNWADNTTTEQTYTQILTIVGTKLLPGKVVLQLQDIEEAKLQQLYPASTWQSTDWPELSSDDAGKAICEPVGTALKFPCVLLRSDATNTEYWYGVCTGTPKAYAISSITSGTKTIVLSSAPVYALVVGQTIHLHGTSAADGVYTVASASGTTIVVNETLPAATGGIVRVMPQPLTVYRNKRVVGASEYNVQHQYDAGDFTNGNFALGGSGWGSSVAGTGTVTFATGSVTITATNSSNWGRFFQTLPTYLNAGYIALEITVSNSSTTGVFVNAFDTTSPNANGRVAPAGTTTTLLLKRGPTNLNVVFYPANLSGSAIVTNVRIIRMELAILKFTQPQIDFNGTNYAIEADCAGVESRNASTEIQRLLGKAGVSTDTTTFNAAIAASFAQLVDCDYGRTGQRRIDAILDDVLQVARAGLSRQGTGAYSIWQDIAHPGAPTWMYDESLADPVNVTALESSSQPTSVGLNYAPSSADANQMQVTMTRAVTAGIMGPEQPREIRYLRDATTADQLLCYLALRRWRNRTATADLYQQQVTIGDTMALTSPRNWPGQRTFIVWKIRRIRSGNELTLREYDAAVYTYTAGTLPPNAPTGYQPDYSFTPPLAPTALKVTATAARVANDGTTTSYATVQATPPVANWEALWFAAVHNVTGEITLANSASIGGGNYGATLGPLRPGEVYRLQCYAVNSNNIQGVVQATFDATAIGGGAAVTTFTAAGQVAVPPTVASVTATQRMGKTIRVTWPAVAGTNINNYVLERQVGAGSFVQIYSGLATAHTDDSWTSYATTYTYRVKAQDNYGNLSAAYATSSAVSPSGNVSGGTSGDIAGTTVDTSNRTDVTTVTGTWFNGVLLAMNQNITLTHSLGRHPVFGAVSSGVSGASGNVYSITTTTVGITFFIANTLATGSQWTTQNTTVNAVPSAHNHVIAGASCSGTFGVDYW